MSQQLTEQIAAVLVELKSYFPELRFAQLVVMIATSARGPVAEATYDVEDDEFLEAARELLEQNKHRRPAPRVPTKRAI